MDICIAAPHKMSESWNVVKLPTRSYTLKAIKEEGALGRVVCVANDLRKAEY